MATGKNGMGPDKGAAGAYSFFVRKGVTIMRQRSNRRSDKGRTAKSMAARTLTSNLIHQWRAFGGGLRDCFETKKEGATDYSGFMSVNRRSARVHLTKEQSEAMVTIVDNVCVSSGSLQPVVQVVEREGWMMSDIRLEGLEVRPDTPMMELCNALKESNPGRFHDGDEIRFLRLTQLVNDTTERPYAIGKVQSIVLDNYKKETVGQYFDSHYINDGFKLVNGFLCAEARENSLVAWVHLRKDPKGGVLATTQNLVGSNVLLERFTSEAQTQEAIHSYGPLKQGLAYATNETREASPFPTPSEPLTPTDIMEDKVVISTSVSPSGTGIVRGGGTCSRGMLVALQATPLEGYRFLCWDDGDRNNPRMIEATDNEEFIATFIKEHKEQKEPKEL